MTKPRRWIPFAVALAALACTASASAHAVVSPPVAKSKTLQQFTLSVPTEKEDSTTTAIELTVPDGFAIDSFEAPPAPWKQQVQATGSGEEAVVQKVTWTGGKVTTGQDSVFHFNASASSSNTYRFLVRQTYSDGTVVNWSGPEQSDTPAPLVEARSSFGGGTSTISIVALVVAGGAVLLGLFGLVSSRGRPLA
jgi:uncharacterized protein YcnI